MFDKMQRSLLHKIPNLRHGIETHTGCTISMRTNLPLATMRLKTNKQQRCPIFKLPGEIRNYIYQLVFEDEHMNTALLFTCRNIWLEAHSFPITLAVPTFYFWNGPRDLMRINLSSAALVNATQGVPLPPSTEPLSETQYYQSFFKGLTPLNRTEINHVRIFASESFLSELDLEAYFSKAWFSAKILTITIRSGNCAKIASGANTDWLEEMLSSRLLAGVHVLRLELQLADNQKPEELVNVFAQCTGYYFKQERIDWETRVIATITWKQRSAPAAFRRPRGYRVEGEKVKVDGGVPLLAKPQRRGGRRSQSVWRHNYWKAGFDSPESMKALKDGKTDALTKKWMKTGSLLCLV